LETRKTIIVSMGVLLNEKEKILANVSERFLREGFYKITMNEIASELHISKKTIYKHFPTKMALVEATIDYFAGAIRNDVEKIVNSKENSVIKFCRMIEKIWNIFTKINDKWLNELHTHLPDAWKRVDDFRTKMIFRNVTKLIEQGKSEKLINDFPTPIILNVFLSSVRTTVNPEFVINNNFSLAQAVESTFEILLNGILTEKGKKTYKSFKKRIKK
jgi:AcrR family transcriptional regulator